MGQQIGGVYLKLRFQVTGNLFRLPGAAPSIRNAEAEKPSGRRSCSGRRSRGQVAVVAVEQGDRHLCPGGRGEQPVSTPGYESSYIQAEHSASPGIFPLRQSGPRTGGMGRARPDSAWPRTRSIPWLFSVCRALPALPRGGLRPVDREFPNSSIAAKALAEPRRPRNRPGPRQSRLGAGRTLRRPGPPGGAG